MARAGSRTSFAEAEEDLHVYAGIQVDKRDIERVAEQVGRQVDGWMARQSRVSQMRSPGDSDRVDVFYVSLDGTGIPMRKAELRGRRGKGESGVAKTREVKLGCVFTQTSIDDEGRPIRDEASTSYVGAIECSKLFGQRLRLEAVRRGMHQAKRIVAISDGAAYNKTIFGEQFSRATHIIDLYHAREHLHTLLKALDVPKADRGEWLRLLDHGCVQTIVQRAHALPCTAAAEETRQTEVKYLAKNAKAMRYDLFRKQGYFVGSGVIEAGCRTVVGERLKKSGMFWSVAGANAIIALRCCQLSGRFDDFWEDITTP
jgi:hypothetical protein